MHPRVFSKIVVLFSLHWEKFCVILNWLNSTCRYSSSVERELPKLDRRVRFPLPAPYELSPFFEHFFEKRTFHFRKALRRKDFRIFALSKVSSKLPKTENHYFYSLTLFEHSFSIKREQNNACSLFSLSQFYAITLISFNCHSIIKK